jgi:hypothetical protein
MAVPVADLFFIFSNQRPFGTGVFAQDIPDLGSREDFDRLFIHFDLHIKRPISENRDMILGDFQGHVKETHGPEITDRACHREERSDAPISMNKILLRCCR